jgi:hypothetical protein
VTVNSCIVKWSEAIFALCIYFRNLIFLGHFFDEKFCTP